MSIRSEKDKLRNKMSGIRNRMGMMEYRTLGDRIFANLFDHTGFLSDDIVALYANIKNEVNTRKLHSFLNTSGATIVYPKVDGKKLVFIKADITDLKPGKFGIPEPNSVWATDIYSIKKIDTIIVPGLAFDTHGNRLGHGGGYYDTALRKFTGDKIGICYDFQLLDYVPTRRGDVKVDRIITDKRLIEILD